MTSSRRSRAELVGAVALAWALVALPAAADSTTTETLAPGLVHTAIVRGEAATSPRYRVAAGSFEVQREADARLADLGRSQAAPTVRYEHGAYLVTAEPGAPTRAAAEQLRARLAAAGVAPPLEVEEVVQDLTNPRGPWRIHVLEADPARLRIEVAHADDSTFGVESARALALRRGAVAAVNGGFYVVHGPLRGDATGLLVVDGAVWSEPDRDRGAIGYWDEEGRTRATVGRVRLELDLVTEPVGNGPSFVIPIDGVDRDRGADEVVLYRPEFHPTTLTSPGGLEVAVAGGRVLALRRGLGSTSIPPRGYVVSVGPAALARLPHLQRLRVGGAVTLDQSLRSLLPDPQALWERVRYAASAGPVLWSAGQRVLDPAAESISRVFCAARHPRTAAGARADGTLLLVTVDGRQPAASVGMSCDELADLMRELGAVDAVNLDGGGSTTMVAGSRTLNQPSDDEGDRENGDALLLFPRRDSTP